jgi:uncharacterized membrane protein
MSAELAGLYAIHLLFAGIWAGSVVFVTTAVLPVARNGNFNATPLSAISGKLKLVSRISAVLLLLTGLRMAMLGGYTDTDVLLSGTRGYLVVAMVVLWLVLMGLVEVAGSKLTAGTGKKKVREPARKARPFMLAASLVAIVLLVIGGVLSTGVVL